MATIYYSVSWLDESTSVNTKEFGTDFKAAQEFRAGMDRFYNVRLWREIECGCGERLTLQGDTECDCCGQLYNGAGQKLVPRHMWEEPWDEE
jgi:hypothetical protein